MIIDETHKEFTRELLSIKDIYGFSDAEMFSLLIGSSCFYGKKAGFTDKSIVKIATNTLKKV